MGRGGGEEKRNLRRSQHEIRNPSYRIVHVYASRYREDRVSTVSTLCRTAALGGKSTRWKHKLSGRALYVGQLQGVGSQYIMINGT